MDETHFDVLILGTGLAESIAAAALAKSGVRVLHVDPNEYYGADAASLTPQELATWARERSGVVSPPEDEQLYMAARRTRYTCARAPPDVPPYARQYALSLAPSVIPALGPLISAIVASGVVRYGGFALLGPLAMRAQDGVTRRVPASKEDVFTARDVALADKRRLMKFLMFAAGEFESAAELVGCEDAPFGRFLADKFALPPDMVAAIVYALAHCSRDDDPTLRALLRMRNYLRCAGRYGNSAFLLGHYGGLGEIAQGFCRTCAVNGGVYILGKRLISLARAEGRHAITLDGVPDTLTASLLIAGADHLPPTHPPAPAPTELLACGIVLLGARPALAAPADSCMIVFPPTDPTGRVVRLLVTGSATMSCPPGTYVAHLSTVVSVDGAPAPEEVLAPYVEALLELCAASPGTLDAESDAEPVATPPAIPNPPAPLEAANVPDTAAISAAHGSPAAATTGDIEPRLARSDVSDAAPPAAPWSAFYYAALDAGDDSGSDVEGVVRVRSLAPEMPSEIGDAAAREGERLFVAALRALGREEEEMWPVLEGDAERDDEDW